MNFRESVTAARRWGWSSLRLRLALAILVWVALGIGGIWVSATSLFAKHVEQQYHEELEVHIQELAGLVRLTPDGRPALVRPLSDPRYLVPLSGFYWQVSADGWPPLRSVSMSRGGLDERVAHSPEIVHRTENGPTGPAITYGFVRRGPQGRDVHYLIATDQNLLDEAIAAFTHDLTLWLALLAMTLLLTGLAVVTFAFQPLDRLARAIVDLRQGDRDALKGPLPAEVAPLAEDLNAYIAHNAAVVERARIEAGNLAHSLRTPLAVMTDEAERLARDPVTAAAGAVLLEQSQRMVSQIELRLARARSAASGTLPGSVSRIAQVLPKIISAMQRLHPEVRFSVSGMSADASLPIDPADLVELLSNLLDNAGKWARSTVTVTVQNGQAAGIVIADDGPGLTPEQCAAAGEVGLRFDPEKPGSGLGLAIARDIAQAYGLALRISGRNDGAAGLQVELAV